MGFNSKIILGTAQFGAKYGVNNKTGIPSQDQINKILKLSTFNPLPLIKEMLTFDPLGLKCIADVDKWTIKDYVYDCLKSSTA